jgi:acid phosphatase
VTITGTNFRANAQVTIGGVAASSEAVVNSTTITALTPAHAAGVVDVVVTNTDATTGAKTQAYTYTAPQVAVPQFDHVFIVALENQRYEDVMGAAGMPYLKTLANRYGSANQSYANTHPSIGNYFWMTTGQNITNDSNFNGTVSVDNIVRQMNLAGKTWKSYAQSLPSTGYLGGNVGPYVKRHNPFAYFSDVIDSPAQADNIVPFTQFATDMSNGQLPDYAFIIPDQQNNAHDCPAGMSTCTEADKRANADNWLKNNLDPLLANPAFRQNGLLIITFDESVDEDVQHGGGHVATVIISPKVPQGFDSTTLYQQQSILRVTAEALGLSTYPGAAATAPNMSEFFSTTNVNTSPGITSVSPANGPTTGGNSVTVTGTGFATGATVSIGGTNASAVVVGSTTINAVAPAHANGTVNVVVTNPGGQSSTLTNGYTYGSAPAETVLLADDFNNGSIDGAKWIVNNLYSGFTDPTVAVQETTELQIGPMKQNLDGSHYNGIRSASSFNMTGAYVQVQLVQAPNSATLADAFFTIGADVNNCYRVYVEGGTLFLQTKFGGAKQQPFTTTFDPVNHAFWRISHDTDTGNFVFETAPNNGGAPGTWTQRFAGVWNTSAVPLTNVLFELKAGTWRTETTAGGTVSFDNFKAAKP